MSFAKMLEQTADSDNSYEEELGNAKSELNALIDEISEVRSIVICLPLMVVTASKFTINHSLALLRRLS